MIEEWRGYIQKRNNGSEMVNYNNPDFPSYVHKGYVFPSSSWANDPHYHDDVELLSVTNGFMAYNINGEEVMLEEGDTIYVNSRQIHFSVPKRKERTDYVICIFHPRILCASNVVESKYIATITDNPQIRYLHFKHSEAVGKRIHKLILETPPCMENEFLLTKLYYEIWEQVIAECGNTVSTKTHYSDSQVNSLKAMLTFIKENYASDIGLDDIAQAGSVSRTFCNNLFHKYTDQTPIENLTRFRVSKVAELLNSTTLSMSEIAYSTGFSSASYMGEAFKKYYGESPRSFRCNSVHTTPTKYHEKEVPVTDTPCHKC